MVASSFWGSGACTRLETRGRHLGTQLCLGSWGESKPWGREEGMASRLPGWRRTAAKAKPQHFERLEPQTLIEFPGYDDAGRQQGHLLAFLVNPGDERQLDGGQLWMVQVLAVQDGYYEYWLCNTFGDYSTDRLIPVHLCDRPAGRCGSNTVYRDTIHVDVFRLVPHEMLEKLTWLTDADKVRIDAHPLMVGLRADPGVGSPAPGAAPKSAPRRDDGPEVEVGQPGIDGLAGALGDDQGARGEKRKHKKKQKEKKEKAGDLDGESLTSGSSHATKKRRAEDKGKVFDGEEADGDLRRAISAQKPKQPMLSALELSSLTKREKKRKGKKKKDEKERKKERSSSTSSSESDLFRSAALPKGIERLRRVHQERPGRIASLSLLRLQELLAMTQGRGTAMESTQNPLPPVAVPYLTQVFLSRNHVSSVGVRNLREMRTIAAVIDLVAMNDPLRALDVLLQRLKALEVAHEQQTWSQASQLELVLDDQSSAVFRQELKAAQSEVKANWDLERGPQRARPWRPQTWTGGGVESGVVDGKETEVKDGDKAPLNSGRPRKGLGKGKKGKGKRRW